jgi:hypothetical protein
MFKAVMRGGRLKYIFSLSLPPFRHAYSLLETLGFIKRNHVGRAGEIGSVGLQLTCHLGKQRSADALMSIRGLNLKRGNVAANHTITKRRDVAAEGG